MGNSGGDRSNKCQTNVNSLDFEAAVIVTKRHVSILVTGEGGRASSQQQWYPALKARQHCELWWPGVSGSNSSVLTRMVPGAVWGPWLLPSS